MSKIVGIFIVYIFFVFVTSVGAQSDSTFSTPDNSKFSKFLKDSEHKDLQREFSESDWQEIKQQWRSLNGSGIGSEIENRFLQVAIDHYIGEEGRIRTYLYKTRKRVEENKDLDIKTKNEILAFFDQEIVWHEQTINRLLHSKTTEDIRIILRESATRLTTYPPYMKKITEETKKAMIKLAIDDFESVYIDLNKEIMNLQSQGYGVSEIISTMDQVKEHLVASRYDVVRVKEAIDVDNSALAKINLKSAVENIKQGLQLEKVVVKQIRDVVPNIAPTIIPGLPTGYPKLISPTSVIDKIPIL